MKESFPTEHCGELLRYTFKHLLDGGGISNDSCGHLEHLGGDVANGRLDVVGDPLNEVTGVLVDNVKHLLVDLLGGHASTKHCGGGEVAAVPGVSGAHHVLGIEYLLGEFGHGEGAVLLGSTAGKRSVSDHEEVKTGEGDHVDGKLAEIGVELSREP